MDVWFREDVARVVRAAQRAGCPFVPSGRCEATACLGWEEVEVLPAPARPGRRARGPQAEPEAPCGQVSREMAAYWRGYAAALSTIGAAFGLSGWEAADEATSGSMIRAGGQDAKTPWPAGASQDGLNGGRP